MTVYRAYKYRVYPTPAQARQLARIFGCCRVVYNKALEYRTSAWKDTHQRVTYVDTSRVLTQWKKQDDLSFLREVPNVVLQQSLMDLQDGFNKFFLGVAKYPCFKSKRSSRNSATFTYVGFKFKQNTDGTAEIKLARQTEPLDIRWSRPLPLNAKPKRLTVSQDFSGRYFISITVQEEVALLPPACNETIGIDLGLTDLVVTDTGSKVCHPKHYRALEAKLAKAQREMSRKQKGSKNREKARLKVARIHAKIHDQRHDHLHKLSTKLIRENQTIVAETLRVKNMVKNRSLSKSISDAGWSTLTQMLAYKAEWYGRDFVQIDQWYPSTQLCSTIGCTYQNDGLNLSVRMWTCPKCETRHDRDINAARNIKAAGLAVLACGDGVRLPKVSRKRAPVKASVCEAGSSTARA